MPQHYSDASRESLDTALPDVETFCDFTYQCEECDHVGPSCRDYYGIVNTDCGECGAKRSRVELVDAGRWYYWFCFPGCLPDSDPIGPFSTEADALADARRF
jgi:hypothetical protein